MSKDPVEKLHQKQEKVAALQKRVEVIWSAAQDGQTPTIEELHLLHTLIHRLSMGELSVVCRPLSLQEPWSFQVWIKQAILLLFRFSSAAFVDGPWWWDKFSLLRFSLQECRKRNLRIVPGSFIRKGAWIGNSTIIMPSFINIGAFIDERTMIDSGTSVGSCVFVGKGCHISSNVTLGGVLEPLQSRSVIVEDHVFVGAGCHIVEGIHLGKGSVLGAGVILTQSTKILDRSSGKINYGSIPPGSVVVPGAHESKDGVLLQCAVIVKTVDEGTRQKTSINDLLRVDLSEG